uniref:Uncharacterized protein n=1 Tax=Tanacetum cinerariifolium TaxID=118510 RepID=A0A699HIP6_TANCI|nr:hypothetical protein [Tanacetum cinerariifolium]
MVKPVWNNAHRVNHQNFAKKNMVPKAVLMKSGLVSINTARQVNAAHSKTTLNAARSMSYLSKIAHLTVTRPIHKNTSFKNSNVNQSVNTVRGNPQMDLHNQGVIDSGYLRHMTRNMPCLTDYKDIDGGYVAFGENNKEGKITEKEVKTASTPMETQKPLLKDKDDDAVYKELDDSLVRAATTASSLEEEQNSGNIDKTKSKSIPNESSSQGTNSRGGPRHQEARIDTIAQTRMKLNELMELCTNLQTMVIDLEKTKTTQANEIDSLKKRVKKLERRNKSRTHKLKRLYKVGLTTKVESFRDEDNLADAEMFDADKDLSELKTSNPRLVNQEPIESPTTTTIIPKQKSQDKGIGIMVEEPVKLKKKDQIRLDEEAALKLQAEFDKEEQRLAREKAQKEQEANIALIETWDDVQAKIGADYQLAKRLQAEEQQELTDEEKAILFMQLLKKRRKHFAAKRAKDKRNIPQTQA